MKMALNPRESGKFIAENSKNITIHGDGIAKLGLELVKEINNGNLSVKNFSQNAVHPKSDDPKAIDWIFVVDVLNFCFWSPERKQGWAVDGYTGYFALCAAINRAVKENVNIVDPEFYSKVSDEELAQVLRSDTPVEIPLFSERVKSLHESGKILKEKFGGTFKNVVAEANNSAAKLLQLIVENFPCFRDEATYKGKRVSLYKRAQILVGDIWACFRNEGLGKFEDIDELTMFADYRVPQSLLYWGVFEYEDELLERLKKSQLLENGDEMEVEIRGCSIEAVEQLREYVKDRVEEGRMVNAVLIDHFLWDFRRKYAKKILEMGLPFHKTFCIYY